MSAGIYHLIVRVCEPRRVKVGRLGAFQFPAGYYVYTGSARSGLAPRIARHRRRQKKLRWHIDYLLRSAEIVTVVEVETDQAIECRRNQRVLAMAGARVLVRKFGASDCKCRSHLAYFGEVRPDLGHG